MVQNCEEIYDKVIDANSDIESVIVEETAEIDLLVNEMENRILTVENFKQWQAAYQNGYNSSMGNHIDYFYNTYISEIGFYHELEKAKKIIEFASGDASFIKVFIEMFPEKEFNLIDISEKNLSNIKTKLKEYSNVNYFLNYPEITELKNIDIVFSFLLSQSMPKSLWISHLSKVYNKGAAVVQEEEGVSTVVFNAIERLHLFSCVMKPLRCNTARCLYTDPNEEKPKCPMISR